MLSKRVQVIKHHQVEVSGSICVLPSGTSPVRSGPAGRASTGTAQPQQARVVESNSEYAIIEVVCSCGGKSHIQCNYAHLSEGS